ncbi:MAG: carboxypeptidase-like regulatory domain-containing protein [Bacteroidetes bacterium]|nr:carboxypeptidase-like regulatory domain-containing protein [Bacteroidota bacterium]
MVKTFIRAFVLICILLTALVSRGQSLLDKTITVRVMNGTIETLLDEISRRGEFTFTCSNYLIDMNKKVHLSKKRQSVRSFLDQMFAEATLSMDYVEREDRIILCPRKVNKRFITIKGNLTDTETGMPVVTGNINIAGTYIGTTSDNYGNYTLKFLVNEKGEKLIINYSHVSYEPVSVVFQSLKDTAIDMSLKIRTLNIDEIAVFGMPRIVFRNKDYFVEDYELFEDKVLLTVFENRKSRSSLFLVNNNEEFISETKIPGTPIGTYCDCADNIHLITYYYPYKINIDSSGIGIEPTGQTAINRVNKPCAAIGPDGYYYYYYYGPAKLSVEYVYHNPKKDSDVVFRTVSDTAQLARFKDDPDRLKQAFGNLRGAMADIDVGRLDKTKKPLYRDTLYKPVYAPLFLIRNTICIFNHVEGMLETFDLKGTPVKTVPIGYHTLQGWTQRLFYDKVTHKIYTLHQREGCSFISEIDLQTGLLLEPFKITFKKIEKIQINDGTIYFLYKSPISRKDEYKCLYQQKLM